MGQRDHTLKQHKSLWILLNRMNSQIIIVNGFFLHVISSVLYYKTIPLRGIINGNVASQIRIH